MFNDNQNQQLKLLNFHCSIGLSQDTYQSTLESIKANPDKRVILNRDDPTAMGIPTFRA